MSDRLRDNETHWYALRVRRGRLQRLIEDCREAATDFFAPSDIIATLLFLRCSEAGLSRFVTGHRPDVWVYYNAEGSRPAIVRDSEMEVFRFVVTAGREGLELLGDDRPEYHEGDRVRVIGGPFKGAEGHIKRIKRDRRLVVAVSGVVAVATTYIHPSLLERVTESERRPTI